RIGNEVGSAREYLAEIVADAGARLAHQLLEVEASAILAQITPDRESHVMGNDGARDRFVQIGQLWEFGLDELDARFLQSRERSRRNAFELRVEIPVPVVAHDAEA